LCPCIINTDRFGSVLIKNKSKRFEEVWEKRKKERKKQRKKQRKKETKKETKKQRNKETKKQRNKETKKERKRQSAEIRMNTVKIHYVVYIYRNSKGARARLHFVLFLPFLLEKKGEGIHSIPSILFLFLFLFFLNTIMDLDLDLDLEMRRVKEKKFKKWNGGRGGGLILTFI
jgi:hypothetical protein